MVVPNEELFADVTRLLGEGRKVTINCKGLSMLPVIRCGRDQVVLEKKEGYAVGDIVLFSLGNRYILHRIIDLQGERMTARGDGNWRGTETCPVGNIHGKAVEIVRGGRRRRNPDSRSARLFVKVWDFFLPVRRWILALYRRLPWNLWIRKYNVNESVKY